MNVNQQYIDGSWYDREYSSGWYRNAYINNPEPLWAMECDDYAVSLIALTFGLKKDAAILDCGSGVGQIIRAWRRHGFENVKGIELSAVAVEASGDPDIIRGTVTDMGMFQDKQFDLVSSIALLEHIDESIGEQTIKEMLRVGKRQAHLMAFDKGPDPSHINIKNAHEWGRLFVEQDMRLSALIIRGPLLEDPLLAVFEITEETHHPLKSLIVRLRGNA